MAEYTIFVSLAIFVSTIFLMIKRPRGIRLGYAAGIGAVFSLLLLHGYFGSSCTVVSRYLGCRFSVHRNCDIIGDIRCHGFFQVGSFMRGEFAKGSGLRLYFMCLCWSLG